LAFAPDGRTLAAGCGGWLVLIDLAGGGARLALNAAALGTFAALAYAPDGRTVALAVQRHNRAVESLVLWDVVTEQVRATVAAAPPPAPGPCLYFGLAFSPDSSTLVAGGATG